MNYKVLYGIIRFVGSSYPASVLTVFNTGLVGPMKPVAPTLCSASPRTIPAGTAPMRCPVCRGFSGACRSRSSIRSIASFTGSSFDLFPWTTLTVLPLRISYTFGPDRNTPQVNKRVAGSGDSATPPFNAPKSTKTCTDMGIHPDDVVAATGVKTTTLRSWRIHRNAH
jgi:hypothetical protein